MPRVMPRASITSSTGRPSRRASAALLLLPSSARPSYRPLLPSTSARSAPRSPREAAPQRRVVHQVGVEVEAGPAGGPRQPHRVDVVRALLERLHHRAARGQRRAQAERDRGLARRLVRGGDEQAVHLQCFAAATRSSCGRKSNTRTPTVVSRKAAPSPPTPSSELGQRRHVVRDRAVAEAAARPRGRGRSPAERPGRR